MDLKTKNNLGDSVYFFLRGEWEIRKGQIVSIIKGVYDISRYANAENLGETRREDEWYEVDTKQKFPFSIFTAFQGQVFNTYAETEEAMHILKETQEKARRELGIQ